jgi:hypothetical protein
VATVKKRRRARSISRATDKHQKLRALKCFDEVFSRLREGWPLSELARYIQEDKKEYVDVSRAGLVSVLTDFRASLPPGELIKKRIPQAFLSAKKEVEEGLDEIKELEALYRMQLERVKVDLETEKKIKKLLPTMTSEIKEARQILESVANLKMDLGLQDRAPQKHEVNVEVDETLEQDLSQHFGNPTVKKVLDNPESRYRVMGTVERFLRLTGDKAVAEGQGEGEA